jgi:hypothetical protein
VVFRIKGFVPEWCELIAQFVQGGSSRIKVNDDIGQGLRQEKVFNAFKYCSKYVGYTNCYDKKRMIKLEVSSLICLREGSHFVIC